jgi:HK97 family phage major capsid protein
MDVNDLRQRRSALREQVRSLNDLAVAENRNFNEEETRSWDVARSEIAQLSATIERLDYLRSLDEATITASNEAASAVAATRTAAPVVATRTHRGSRLTLPDSEEYEDAFRSYIRGGMGSMTNDERNALAPHFSMGADTRAMGTTSAAAGGALIPQSFYNRLIEAMKSFSGVRQSRATVFQTATGAPMPIPLVDDTANIGALLSENTQATAQDFSFAQKTLNAYVYTSKLVLVSLQMLQDSAFDIEGYLAKALGTRIARATNADFTTGGGSTLPQGVVTGASSGVVAATGNTTAITYDNLVAMIHSVDPAYRDNAEWMFNDDTLRVIRQLKDLQNRPLWQQDIALGARPTILGYPYNVNQAMAVMAANAKSILFGDFSYYLIRDTLDLRVLRLDERYADFLQVGFIAFTRTDGLVANPGGSNNPIKYYQNSAT